MIRSAALLPWLLAAVCLVADVPDSRADEGKDTREAKALFLDGMKLYNIGHYQEAAERFEAGYLKKTDPSFLFNLGQCYRMMHEPEKEAREYRAYLSANPEAPNRDVVEGFIREADAELRKRSATQSQNRATQLSVTSAPPSEPAAPVYKKWWLWTAVGGALAVGLGVGLGVGLSQSSDHLFPTISFN